MLDGDEAGRKAVERLAGAILGGGAAARVACSPTERIPTPSREGSAPRRCSSWCTKAKPLTQHLFETTPARGPAASFEEKMAALDRLRPITTQLPSA